MATPNNAEGGMLAQVFTCRNSFNFLRCVMGMAAFVCSTFATSYRMNVLVDKDKEDKRDDKSSLLDLGIVACIILLPFAMLGRHLVICHFVPGISRRKARCCRFGMRIITLLMVSFTMLESATATATEVGQKDELRMVALVLSSIILCEGALLAEDNYGVFELVLTVFVVQFIKTFPKLHQPYWYGIVLLVYAVREGVMYAMKKMKREVDAKSGEDNVKELRVSWDLTNQQLRNNHRINVGRDLPSFARMDIIIDTMSKKKNDDTAV